jgi:hypothetical protein
MDADECGQIQARIFQILRFHDSEHVPKCSCHRYRADCVSANGCFGHVCVRRQSAISQQLNQTIVTSFLTSNKDQILQKAGLLCLHLPHPDRAPIFVDAGRTAQSSPESTTSSRRPQTGRRNTATCCLSSSSRPCT